MSRSPAPPWSQDEIEDLKRYVEQGFTSLEIAEALGRTFKAVEHKRREVAPVKKRGAKKDTGEKFEVVENDKSIVITSRSATIRTLQDAMEAAKIDTEIWEVDRYVSNKWDVGSKLRQGGASADQLVVVELWQVKVFLRRKLPKIVTDAAVGLADRLAKFAPKKSISLPKGKAKDPHLVYIGLHDHHFGKLAWADETGDNYDLRIAESLYESAGAELMRKASGFEVDRFVLPIGHDFLHVDGMDMATTSGTPQDVDGRFAKIFEVGQMAVIRLVDYLARHAPVEVIWIPGNHDYLSSFMLAKTIEAWFRSSKHVTVDASPRPRKRIHYGINLIGCTHGCDEKPSTLPGIMAQEWPKEWAESKCREWLVGDKHKPKETHYNTADTHDGVMVRILSSLAGTDLWHYKKGYVGGQGRAAQAICYSKHDGFVAQFNANEWRKK